MLLDQRDVDIVSIANGIRAEGFRPCTLPNLDRARFHLRGSDPFTAVVLPLELGDEVIAEFLDTASRLRPELPVIVVRIDHSGCLTRTAGDVVDSNAVTVAALTPSGFEPKLEELVIPISPEISKGGTTRARIFHGHSQPCESTSESSGRPAA